MHTPFIRKYGYVNNKFERKTKTGRCFRAEGKREAGTDESCTALSHQPLVAMLKTASLFRSHAANEILGNHR
jgi:hypothetical protein